MTREAAMKAAMELPPKERLALAMELWDAVGAEVEQIPLSDAQRRDLERRRAYHESNPSDTIPWEQVHRELRERFS